MILKEIYKINPKVQVYVMGYFNPFPHSGTELQPLIGQLVESLNGAIQTGMAGTNAIFVPTGKRIAEDYLAYLPNPINVHLSEAGYKVVAELFAKAMLEKIPTPAIFTDIATSEFKEFIEQAVTLGLIKGHEDGTFKPNDKLTRVQAAAIIVRALDLKAEKAAPFTDIGDYAAETQAEIAAAYENQIVKGSNGKFMPAESVTRAQLALMIKRAYELKSIQPYLPTEIAPFSDFGNYDEETKNAITMLHKLGIANGSDGKYMPSKATTRGQAAKMFVNFVNLPK